jgi:hypothetical protein
MPFLKELKSKTVRKTLSTIRIFLVIPLTSYSMGKHLPGREGQTRISCGINGMFTKELSFSSFLSEVSSAGFLSRILQSTHQLQTTL